MYIKNLLSMGFSTHISVGFSLLIYLTRKRCSGWLITSLIMNEFEKYNSKTVSINILFIACFSHDVNISESGSKEVLRVTTQALHLFIKYATRFPVRQSTR